MKFFGATFWAANATDARTGKALRVDSSKLLNFAAGLPLFGKPEQAQPSDLAGIHYVLTPSMVRTFATAGFPFLTFYEFADLAGWYRDTYFAPDHVPGYKTEAGHSYTVWTLDTTSAHRRHIFLDDLKADVTLSFTVPSLDQTAWFPLRIRLFDRDGLYFQHDQKLVVERLVGEGGNLTSWKKIPNLRNALERLHASSCSV